MDVILAGDVGGTKTHLALYRDQGSGQLEQIRDSVYVTKDFPSLEEVATGFLNGERPTKACFGVPGPVVDGVAHATNVPWSMDERVIGRVLGAQIRLINDLEATAYGVLHLGKSELAVLQVGQPPPGGGNIAVIAAGTGLGEAGIILTSHGYRTIASEGGHCDFAPRNRDQEQLLTFLTHEFGHVSFERVLSGPGLHNIYRFLLSCASGPEPQWLTERMRIEDPSEVISESAIAGRDPRCVRALEIFIEIYGAEASNLALKLLSVGGVYLGGGIAPKILPFLQRPGFMNSFLDKGRLKSTLERMPVRVSLNSSAALIGAAYTAREIEG